MVFTQKYNISVFLFVPVYLQLFVSVLRTFSGLKSLLLALSSARPAIVYAKQSMMCEELARAIYKDFSGGGNANASGKNEPIILILDRRLDPVTPLLNQVFYNCFHQKYFSDTKDYSRYAK